MKTTTIPRHGKSLKDRSYLVAVFAGLRVTLGHFFGNLISKKQMKNVPYPEVKPDDITSRYRGVHRLTKRDDGSIRCVACFMCATACPAECIDIKATQRKDGVDEKEPEIFNIDLLECVYCGECVEACPCDAIRMDSGIFSFVAKSRDEFVLSKEKLLSIPKGDI